MKITKISLLLLIVAAVVVVSGCKASSNLPTGPASLAEEGASTSEQAVDAGLQELDELDSLAEETDLGLEELDKLDLE